MRVRCYSLLSQVTPLSFLSRTSPLAYVSPSHSCTAEPIHLSHTLSLTHVSPLHPRVAYFDSVLPSTRAWNKVPPKRRHALSDGISNENDWRVTPVLSSRAGKLSQFISEFSEPPQEATEWKSTPSGCLRSYRR
jgi:hypothetical protein